jgi:flagellar hook-length control protein FliK
MALDAVLPTPTSGARSGGPALGAPASPQDGPSFADVLSAADRGAPPAAPAPRAGIRRGGAEPGRSGAPAGTAADRPRDPADERADPVADAASPQKRRATPDGPAHTHGAAHGRGQALAQARARAAAQAVERARAERASRGDTASGETGMPPDGLAGPARGRPAAGPLAQTDDATAARDAALHAAAAAADPALAPLIAAGRTADGAPHDGLEPAAAASAAEAALAQTTEPQDPTTTRGTRAPIGGDAAARTEPADADAAPEGRLLAADSQTSRALSTEIAAAAATASVASAAAARTGDPASGTPAGASAAALAAAALAAGSVTGKDLKTAGLDGPAALPSGAPAAAAPAAGAPGAGARQASARAAAGLSPLGAGAATAGAGEASVAGAQTFAGAQADALRALGERLRSGADGGSDSGQAPTTPVFQPPLPAGVAAPRAEAAQESLAQGGSYPITVPVQDPRFADAFSERVTWLIRDGLQGAELTLNPQELGPIRIELAIDGDAASIGVIAANAETRGAIEQALPRLREMLSAQGLQLGGTMVDAGSGRGSQGDGGRGRGARAEGRDGIAALLGGSALEPAAALPARAAGAGRIDVFA